MAALMLAACGAAPPAQEAQTAPPAPQGTPTSASGAAESGRAAAPQATPAPTAQRTPTSAVVARPTAVRTATAQPTSPPADTPAPQATQTATPEPPRTPPPDPTPTRPPTPPVTVTAATPTATPAATPAETPTSSPTPTPSAPPPRAQVGRVATTRSVDGLQRPADETDTFNPGERVYVSVEFRDVREGAVLGFRWESTAGCAGDYETPPQPPIRRGWFAFHLDETNCAGPYVVEVTVDGERASEVRFRIRG